MSSLSLNSTSVIADGNFTDSSYSMMSNINVVNDEWDHFLQQLYSLCENNTGIIDAFCDAVFGKPSSTNGLATPSVFFAVIWDHPMTKTVGWTIIMLLKTMFFEQTFDHWSGTYRFLNLGTTLVPFGMAAWTIYDTAMDKVGDAAESDGIPSLSSVTVASIVISLWSFMVHTPVVRNWILTGLASLLLQHVLFGKIRSSKTFSRVASIPGILATLISFAFWITSDETNIAALLLGSYRPELLLLQTTVLRWTAHVVSGWYCYAWMVQGMFGTKRFTSFPCFLFVVAAGKIIATPGIPF